MNGDSDDLPELTDEEIDRMIDRAARLRRKGQDGSPPVNRDGTTGPKADRTCPACGSPVRSLPGHLPCDGDDEPEAGDACPECDGGPLEELPAYATRRLRCPDCSARQ